MPVSVFTPEHRTLDSMLLDGTTFLIPDYQRPYSWQCVDKSDKNNQVNQMWRDLWHAFQEQRNDREYFLGSMVVIETARRTYEVVDGQQRLTTLLLLLAAMKCFLESNQKNAPDVEERFFLNAIQTIEQRLYNRDGFGLTPELKVKIQRSIGFDFDTVLKEAIQCKEKASLPAALEHKYSIIAQRYFDNRAYFSERLREQFLTKDGIFTREAAHRFAGFFQFLQTRISLVIIQTSQFETAYTIFEILNNRGLPLTNKDLLRNFFIREYRHAIARTVPNPEKVASEHWERLETQYLITEDFISRWVESLTAEQQQYSAFNDLKRLYDVHPIFDTDIGRSRIEQFEVLMEAYLGYYSLIREPDEIQDPMLKVYLRIIEQLDNVRYSRDFLLTAFRYMDRTRVPLSSLCKLVQTYVTWLWYVQLVPGVRFSYSNVYKAIHALNDGEHERAAAPFELTHGQRMALQNAIEGEIEDNSQARLLLLFYVWLESLYVEDVATLELDPNRASLEHILPQKPAPNAQWLKDFSEEERTYWTYRLGNMTLLTSKMNSKLRNADFAVKLGRTQREGYRATHLPITRELVKLPQFTPAVAHARQLHFVETLSKALKLS